MEFGFPVLSAAANMNLLYNERWNGIYPKSRTDSL